MKKTDFRAVVYKCDIRDKTAEPKRICSFAIERPGELLSVLEFCEQNDVEWWVSDTDEEISEDARSSMDMGAFVDSYNVSFGGDDVWKTIEIYLK